MKNILHDLSNFSFKKKQKDTSEITYLYTYVITVIEQI